MALFSVSWKLDMLLVVIGIFTIIYYLVKRMYSYWDRNGFKSLPNTNYLFGHLSRAFLQNENIGETIERIYCATDEPFVGIYGAFRPILFIRNPELIQKILIKDFSHFTDRGMHCNESYDPMSGNLFGLGGQRWREMHARLAPAYSSGKVKAMFPTLLECGSTLQNFLEKLANNNQLFDVYEVGSCHFTNVTASIIFGIEVDSINDPNHDFRKYGRKIFELSVGNAFRVLMYVIAPGLMNFLRIKCCNPASENFIISMVKQNLEYREKFNICRKDIFQLLIQLRNSGNVQQDDEWETAIKTNESQKAMSLLEIAAQTGSFYAASVETSALTLMFVMHELAANSDIQRRVHDEIDQALENHNGQLTFESISEMKYLEACINETLRMYSVSTLLLRTCVNDYRIPGTDQMIEKGMQIIIPTFALHRDEKYYKNPDKFDPNRFSEENMVGIDQINRPFYAFGDGPRKCIGGKMGILQIKAALVVMLQKFRFEYEEKMKNRELKFDRRAYVLAPDGGIHLRVFKR